MRRADRLFRIVQVLRAGRLLTARDLARKLEVSERTVYRDVRDLQLSGMPILGEAGVGYTLRRDMDLPPLMFNANELSALVLGARLVKAWGGDEAVAGAADALRKIEAVLPPEMRQQIDSVMMYAPGYRLQKTVRTLIDRIHTACVEQRIIRFDYCREDGQWSHNRRARPLALYFWGGAWTAATWCELRNDFRLFRLDRMEKFELLNEPFTQKKGQRLEDYLRQFEKPKNANG
jgi:predicted DNA-binding transcriptional regulator YafY